MFDPFLGAKRRVNFTTRMPSFQKPPNIGMMKTLEKQNVELIE
jgi:hypothetical protein